METNAPPQEKEQSSYEEGSSEEIIVEFCQTEKELTGATVNNMQIVNGTFGTAELLHSKNDKLLLFDTHARKLKLIPNIYRSIIVKRTKKRQPKQNTENPENLPEQQQQAQQLSQNMFDSSEHPTPPQKPQRKKKNNLNPQKPSKTRLLRKLRTLAKPKQSEK